MTARRELHSSSSGVGSPPPDKICSLADIPAELIAEHIVTALDDAADLVRFGAAAKSYRALLQTMYSTHHTVKKLVAYAHTDPYARLLKCTTEATLGANAQSKSPSLHTTIPDVRERIGCPIDHSGIVNRAREIYLRNPEASLGATFAYLNGHDRGEAVHHFRVAVALMPDMTVEHRSRFLEALPLIDAERSSDAQVRRARRSILPWVNYGEHDLSARARAALIYQWPYLPAEQQHRIVAEFQAEGGAAPHFTLQQKPIQAAARIMFTQLPQPLRALIIDDCQRLAMLQDVEPVVRFYANNTAQCDRYNPQLPDAILTRLVQDIHSPSQHPTILQRVLELKSALYAPTPPRIEMEAKLIAELVRTFPFCAVLEPAALERFHKLSLADQHETIQAIITQPQQSASYPPEAAELHLRQLVAQYLQAEPSGSSAVDLDPVSWAAVHLQRPIFPRSAAAQNTTAAA